MQLFYKKRTAKAQPTVFLMFIQQNLQWHMICSIYETVE